MPPRLRIDTVNCAVDDATFVRAQVQLSLFGRVHIGRAGRAIMDGSWRRAVAEATINAVKEFLPSGHRITLDTAMEVTAAQHSLIVVTVMLDAGDGEEFLAGTARVGEDRHTAVTKAVLHALNRRLEMLLQK